MLMDTFPWRRFKRASSQSMLSPLAQVQTPQYDHTMGASAGSAASSGSVGGGKWKKVLDHLGKMTSPKPDWSLGPQNLGVRSPWSPTNIPWSPISPVPRKKKEGPY